MLQERTRYKACLGSSSQLQELFTEVVFMKSDVLTVAAIVFVVGTIASSFGITDVFESEASAPPSALQQGVVVAQHEQKK